MIEENIKLTSEEWQKRYIGRIEVLDPDGWHRDERFQKEWHEDLITEQEWLSKTAISTCRISQEYLASLTTAHPQPSRLREALENARDVLGCANPSSYFQLKDAVVSGLGYVEDALAALAQADK